MLPTPEPVVVTSAPTAATEAMASTHAPTATAAFQNSSALPVDRPASFTVPALVLSVGLSLALVAGVLIVQFRRRRG